MSEKGEQVYNAFIDLIEVLKQKDKCNCPNFQKLWIKKNQNVRKRINELSKDEIDLFESKYKEWCKKQKIEK